MLSLLPVGALLGLLLPALLPALGPASDDDLAKAVVELLETRCVSCHGAERQRAGLRVDERAALLAGSGYGTAAVIDLEHPDEGELLRRLRSDDPDERMPADEPPLTPGEIDQVRRWLTAGASWPAAVGATPGDGEDGGVGGGPLDGNTDDWRHWSYVPPQRPPVPDVAALSGDLPSTDGSVGDVPPLSADSVQAIDRFVEQALIGRGLPVAPRADRTTLVRRLHLDLTGLPPSPAEVDRFLADDAADAYTRLVDRLLASPEHAEHLTRWWLDLARYADSDGYEKDDRRAMWRWRDWVLDAFEADMPFDQFTVHQLAGDLLPDADVQSRLATGFHRNTMLNKEGGTDPEEFRVAAVVDRVNTTAQVWMGSTLACAQCHDHKFDPFRQTDYYSVYAFFDQTEDTGNADGPLMDAPTREQQARLPALRVEIAGLEARVERWTPAVQAEWADLVPRMVEATDAWEPWRPTSTRALEGSRLAVLDDGSVLAFGDLPATETYVLEFPGDGRSVAALRLDVFTDESLPEAGPGRPSHGNFVLNDLRAQVLRPDGELEQLALGSARAGHSQDGYDAGNATDGDKRTGWAIAGGIGEDHQLVVPLAEPRLLQVGETLRVQLEQLYGNQHLLGRVALRSAGQDFDAGLPVATPAIEHMLAAGAGTGAGTAAGADPDPLRSWLLAHTPSLAGDRARLAVLRDELRFPTVMVLQERVEPRETRLLELGSFLSPGEAVEPGVPRFLGELPDRTEAGALGPATRLDLARWLVAREHPLTARVLANRLWALVFGEGLVTTRDDFGTQGERPSHPELLDWLAVELMEDGWSVRRFLRRLVLSDAYARASTVDPHALDVDPDNRLLARASRWRLDAEVLRDVGLATSGLLSSARGGASVFPPQPDGTWAMTYSGDRWETSEGDDRYRRGLYTFWRRTATYPTYMVFDAPSRELSCTRRSRTNTPLQALTLLNDPAFVECAGGLALRMLEEGGDDPAAIVRAGFRRCVSRAPDAEELALLLALHADERQALADDPGAAQRLLAALATPAMAGLQAADDELALDHAAWVLVANVLLNLDETVSRS